MILTKEKAHELLEEADKLNPGPWVSHSVYAAKAAKSIAKACGLNEEKAYLYGLMHDIGRYAGVHDFRHVIDGYKYLEALGYHDIKRACLTHSFVNQDVDDFTGVFDCTKDELEFVEDYLKNTSFDIYDRIVQICDYLALPTGFCILEKRMIDVALRKGVNDLTIIKWKSVFQIKDEIESMMPKPIYSILGL